MGNRRLDKALGSIRKVHRASCAEGTLVSSSGLSLRSGGCLPSCEALSFGEAPLVDSSHLLLLRRVGRSLGRSAVRLGGYVYVQYA